MATISAAMQTTHPTFFTGISRLLVHHFPFQRYGKIRPYALVAQWIERYPPEVDVGVRVAAGAPSILTPGRWKSLGPSHPPSPKTFPFSRSNASLPFPLPVIREGGRGKGMSNVKRGPSRGVGGWDGFSSSPAPLRWVSIRRFAPTRPSWKTLHFPNSTVATFFVPVMNRAIVLRPNRPCTSPGLSRIVRPMCSSWAL